MMYFINRDVPFYVVYEDVISNIGCVFSVATNGTLHTNYNVEEIATLKNGWELIDGAPPEVKYKLEV